MNDRTYVYAIHIATTPEKLWAALTSNEFIRQYFPDFQLDSDWQAGSPLKYFTADGKFFSEGEVLESSPPNRLSYTWPDGKKRRLGSCRNAWHGRLLPAVPEL